MIICDLCTWKKSRKKCQEHQGLTGQCPGFSEKPCPDCEKFPCNCKEENHC